MLLLAVALAAPSIDTPLRTGAKAPHDAAVVIGIEDYAFLPDVPYAERDAQAVEDLLVYTLGVPYDRVRRLGGNASREQILASVDDAADLVGPEGTLWLYYAGHGAASASRGERLLLGVDTMANALSFEARAVPVSALKEAAADVHRIVLMVDACFAGASRGGEELLPGTRFAVPAYAAPSGSAWIEWNATQPDQLSGPLEAAEHGAFTFAAVGALRGWADGQLSGTPDGTITLEEAQLFVAQALRTLDLREQRPHLAASDLSAPLVTLPVERVEGAPGVEALKAFVRGSPPAEVASPPVPEPVPATEAPLATSDVSSPLLGTLKWIPPGTFTMGLPPSDPGRRKKDPQHEVTLTAGFWMMEREVTQGMWRSVMGKTRSYSSCGDACPVGNVSWKEADEFARRLSAQEGVSYRLPTEAEWEYAARGGASTRFAGSDEATDVGWIKDNSGGRTHPGCERARNGYDLCDMTGNLWEWTWDWVDDYSSSPGSDPMGPPSGTYRINRGGSYVTNVKYCEVGFRMGYVPGGRKSDLGFRLVRTAP